MNLIIQLPVDDGTLQSYTVRGPGNFIPATADTRLSRIAYSAAHVVADPRAAIDPWLQSRVDWDATIGYRRRLWSMGLGVAEAMDTAQRGMGLDWPTSLELIRRSLDAAKDFPAATVASGCGTDQLAPEDARSVDDVIRVYEEQMEAIESLDGKLIVMASRALARVATGPRDYERVYGRVLSQARQPVVLHWLGDMFDPALKGYWGLDDVDRAMDTALGIINAHADKVDGIKISLLDKDKEIAMRRRLPAGVRMYTGDDFNYAELIEGDGVGDLPTHRHSDALLGIFDAIAPAASAALVALAKGDTARFHQILAPTVPLSRHIFQAPTRFYKTGVVFMAWLNGHQDHFVMVGGQQSTRSLPGAGGTLGAPIVAKADPDGYTVLIHSSSHTVNPATYENLSFDTARDFAGVTPIASLPNVLIVSPAKNYKTVGDLVAAARAKPGSLNASAGAGSATHLNAEKFRIGAGIEAVHIPFKGSPEAINEVMGGRVKYYFAPVAPVVQLINENKVAALAVGSPKRSSLFPNVPTTVKAGIPGSEYNFWIGMLVPAKTPKPIVERLYKEMQAALASPDVKERLAKLGADPMAMTSEQFDAYIKNEITANTALVKKANIKVQ